MERTWSATYAPNVSWLFPELAFADRLAAVRTLGFCAIEFGFPTHADLSALEAAHHQDGVKIVLFNQDVPVWDEENRGYLVDPSRRDEFKRELESSLLLAERLGAAKVMLPVGVRLPALDREAQRMCLIENLEYAAPLAESAGVLLTIEMLNPFDNPGYFLTSTGEGIELVGLVDHPSIRFQFDTYHVQRMEGNLAESLTANMSSIGHIQFADEPGRHEPGTGNIPFQTLLETISQAGYQDWIGLEYIPKAEGAGSLAWCRRGDIHPTKSTVTTASNPRRKS